MKYFSLANVRDHLLCRLLKVFNENTLSYHERRFLTGHCLIILKFSHKNIQRKSGLVDKGDMDEYIISIAGSNSASNVTYYLSSFLSLLV